MKQSNRKAPLVFRVGVALLCAMLITTNMMGGLYARYSTTVIGTASARVAKISYKIDPEVTNENLFLSSHALDADKVPADCTTVAVTETFTITNDGEVAYDYKLTLSLIDQATAQESTAYSLKSFADKAWIPTPDGEDGQTQDFVVGMFSYYENDKPGTSSSPTLTGTLAIGASVTYKIFYFINLQDASLNQRQVLNYDIICTQND